MSKKMSSLCTCGVIQLSNKKFHALQLLFLKDKLYDIYI